ncbi:MAG TPA: hypothetical protein VJH37_02105 [Candidatus Nanoarchaeia archaeon]|nr:hypothetical protein [Candidatus Nanoarchaeia archaeon]
MKSKGNKLLPFAAVTSILLLVGLYTGTDNLVTADQGQAQPMMQQMGTMMSTMQDMHEDCETLMDGMMQEGNMDAMMQGMIGSQGMTQEEHESHHR